MPLPIQFLLYLLIGWVTRQQAEVIEYLKAENLALREKLGGKRLRFTDAERRRLARKAKPLGRARLRELWASRKTQPNHSGWILRTHWPCSSESRCET
jgi:hypothetical protein